MSRSRRPVKKQLSQITGRSEIKAYFADIDRDHYKGKPSFRKRKKGARRFIRARIRRDEKLVARRMIDETLGG